MFAGQHGQADHRVLVDSDQAAGLADTATLLQMLEYRERFLLRSFARYSGVPLRSEKRCWQVRQASTRRCLLGPLRKQTRRLARPRWP